MAVFRESYGLASPSNIISGDLTSGLVTMTILGMKSNNIIITIDLK